ncbi:FAD binding domain protein [Aspergillus steynii IBT 23096]|uniref:FAD binding domain protein n=1 Tax=Aspergillus steynii IBT 23096 TaxID=1392250 RepID=A0A2I2FZV5_9EURO|nr:FAD binding domain protein [Aspergillus steynii IBT 23096]PLB46159.1 FAD binding domain protein [Aspergillus steynii IBT 23096]
MGDTVRTDVLIVGAGPSGLMAAAWMAQMGVKTTIIDQKSHHTRCGRADGLESRTLEILDSFGLGDKVWAQANHTVEIALWGGTDGKLQRHSVTANSKPGWSRFHESTLSQGQIEEYLMEYVRIRKHIDVRRQTIPTSLDIDYDVIDDHDAYPIRVNLENAPSEPKTPSDDVDVDTPNSELSETQSDDSGYAGMGTMVEAKYILGCDGAHSWLRKQLGLRLEGETYGDTWGVMDIIPLTDFPDIRKRFIIKSKHGTLMMIPRERKLVRVYVELPPEAAERYRAEHNADVLMDQVATIMQPYTIKTSHIDWSTIYTVGQRICRKIGLQNRIFLAGDAIHTHSPKAGQGMNVSMQDTFNLGWKLASVIKGVLDPRVLETYQQERLPVAERLIALDQRICRGMCSQRNVDPDIQHGQFDDDHKRALEEENSSMSGLAVIYQPNSLVTTTVSDAPWPKDAAPCSSRPGVATNLRVGARIPSVLILNQSDSQACHLQQILPSTGQWNLIVFGGDIAATEQKRRVEELANALEDPDSAVQKLNDPLDVARRGFPTLGVFLVHCADRHSIELNDLPLVFRPWTKDGVDYGRVWADGEAYHHAGGGKLYSSFGIQKEGCMALLRPDQHLAFLSDIEDVKGLEQFLQSVMPDAKQGPIVS